MNRKRTRLQAKGVARASLAGIWMKGAALIAISLLLGMFCSNFIPIYAPAQPITAQQLANMNASQMLMLFADMLVPEVITRNYIARILISAALFLLIIPPFQQGTKQFFVKILQGEKPKLRTVFMWYANLGKVFGSIGLYIYIWLLALLWGVLIFALPAAMMAFSLLYSMLGLYLVSVVLYFVSLILFGLKLMSYLPAYYLYAHNSSAGVLNAVRTSVSITRGRLAECLVFQLSFILWNIVVLFSGNIGRIFFQPYYLTANAAFVGMLVSDTRAETTENAAPTA